MVVKTSRPTTMEDVAEHFSFDLKLFHARLDTGDDWQKVIQGQLFLDHTLTRTLEEALSFPDRLSLDRMTFSSKLDFCSAMGLVDVQLEQMIRHINKLRNSIAHDLHFVITNTHSNLIRNSTPKLAKQLIQEQCEVSTDSLLSHCLKVAVVILDINRQSLARIRAQQKEHTANLKVAFENARRVLKELEEKA